MADAHDEAEQIIEAEDCDAEGNRFVALAKQDARQRAVPAASCPALNRPMESSGAAGAHVFIFIRVQSLVNPFKAVGAKRRRAPSSALCVCCKIESVIRACVIDIALMVQVSFQIKAR